MGRITEKVEPSLNLLVTLISAPSNLASSREIERPSPVPPYFRDVPRRLAEKPQIWPFACLPYSQTGIGNRNDNHAFRITVNAYTHASIFGEFDGIG